MIFDIQLSQKRERYVPLVICFSLYLFCYFMLRRIQIPPDYKSFCLGCSLSVLFVLILVSKWKISLHMVGMGGMTGLIVYLIIQMQVNLEFYLIVAILVAGLVGTSRLILKAHKPFEIYSGFIAGWVVILSVMLIL
jgi:membrane-associated phospholipid phosphatase